MNDDELIAVLEDAGLSPYQAEAYVTLLGLGSAPARDVADACDVPDPRIYDVLRDLESRGYVETFQQDSLNARVHDPETVLQDLRSRSSDYLDAAEDIEDRWQRPDVGDHEVSIVKRLDTVLDRTEELIGEARCQVQIAIRADQYGRLRGALERAYDRGASVSISVWADADADLPETSAFEGACTEVKRPTIPIPFLAVVDRNWTCFAPQHRSVDEYGVLVNERTHTFVFHWFFVGCLWETWETIYDAAPPDGGREFVDVGECLRTVVPLLEEGATVRVRVQGYETETNEATTLEGPIVDVHAPGDEFPTDVERSVPLLPGPVGFVVEDGDRAVEVGGWGATLEDVEATRITIRDVER